MIAVADFKKRPLTCRLITQSFPLCEILGTPRPGKCYCNGQPQNKLQTVINQVKKTAYSPDFINPNHDLSLGTDLCHTKRAGPPDIYLVKVCNKLVSYRDLAFWFLSMSFLLLGTFCLKFVQFLVLGSSSSLVSPQSLQHGRFPYSACSWLYNLFCISCSLCMEQ